MNIFMENMLHMINIFLGKFNIKAIEIEGDSL